MELRRIPPRPRPARALGRLMLVLAAAVIVVPATAAAQGPRQEATLEFTTKKPGSPSGQILEIDYRNPHDPDAKPPAVRRVVATLARGGRYDTSIPAPCPASDAELMLLGKGACPPGAVVGGGEVTVDTGFPGPARIIAATVELLNDANELIFLSTIRGSSVRVVTRTTVTRRRTIAMTPFLPGTPPDGAAIDTVEVELARIMGGRRTGRAYITTPPRCPARGYWVNRIAFTYDDGVTQRVRSKSPCRRPGATHHG